MDVIDQIDDKLLWIVAPECPAATRAKFIEPLRAACRRFRIDTVREVACFLAQGAHESGGFTQLDENLNYSALRLTQVWPKRFPNLRAAEPYARNPQALANRVYANRMGNGNEDSGDGFRFRGAGVFQLTGRANQTRCADALNMSIDNFPAYIRTPEGAAMSAAWFFHDNGLEALAATPGVEDETRRINGGVHGLGDRRKRFDGAIAELLRRGA